MGHNQRVGAWGEAVAAEFLEAQGYVIVARNWRSTVGEIDLVAVRDAVYVIVEVKTRTSRWCGSAAEAVTRPKRHRLSSLAWEWYRAHGQPGKRCQVDVIAVEGDANSYTVEHFEGIAA
ncbi:YraN family protein [Zhihengliuella flava]|uniref:UPF0102 protein IW252_000261 n=1 Tax=Zhihengliuella flava TaxID=1285193 RepID=A0A931GKG6_9MICC|nr:YraN family protein [Zhihengliuella flava]MBG6083494.1 putative endonuclease [Zhihengliuella flava]